MLPILHVKSFKTCGKPVASVVTLQPVSISRKNTGFQAKKSCDNPWQTNVNTWGFETNGHLLLVLFVLFFVLFLFFCKGIGKKFNVTKYGEGIFRTHKLQLHCTTFLAYVDKDYWGFFCYKKSMTCYCEPTEPLQNNLFEITILNMIFLLTVSSTRH